MIETPLEPDRGDSASAVIGDRLVIGDLGSREEILVDREKIGPAEIGPEGVDLLAYLGREPQILGVAEQIAVFPESAAPMPWLVL